MRFIEMDVLKPDVTALMAASELLADNIPVVFPSDTTYGILMRYSAANAERLHTLRRENKEKPFLVVVSEDADWQSLTNAALLPTENQARIQEFWPGTNTLLMPKAAHLSYPPTDSIAIRMPAAENNRAFHTLVQFCDFPLMAPSFNRPGEAVITDKKEAEAKFGAIEYAFWDERFQPQAPSSIWDLRETPPKKIR